MLTSDSQAPCSCKTTIPDHVQNHPTISKISEVRKVGKIAISTLVYPLVYLAVQAAPAIRVRVLDFGFWGYRV